METKKKYYIFWVWIWVSILKIRKKNKIDTQIHTQKLKFFFILNHLFRNLQEIRKILKLKTQILKKFKTQTQTWTFEYFWVHMSVFFQKTSADIVEFDLAVLI